ncbi:MAG: hypothetical protein IJC04_06860 [Oscillospiraceae bacterium]|nr:hypothetical protein [Oscillospiraceae bacterium]
MSNTINVTISENAVLAHALYEVIDEHYDRHYFEDFVSHLPKRESKIKGLLDIHNYAPLTHCIREYICEMLICATKADKRVKNAVFDKLSELISHNEKDI